MVVTPSPASEPDPLLLTPRQTARQLGISERTLWSLSQNGTIPVVRIGRCVRYSRAALVAWIAGEQSRQPEVQQ